ncbi:MAG TPA: zf-HC2 domain-containing protein, partial [Elusimicrobiota bacterium]|nr:zf-HC2 domain-containing protein [Elusimicrobiota bacterium]
MNCHSFINVLDLHREGRLSPRRAKAVERHLGGCAACRALAAPAPSAEPSARAPLALKARLLAAAKSAPGAPAAAPEAAPEAPAAASDLPLWPREARGIALAA